MRTTVMWSLQWAPYRLDAYLFGDVHSVWFMRELTVVYERRRLDDRDQGSEPPPRGLEHNFFLPTILFARIYSLHTQL